MSQNWKPIKEKKCKKKSDVLEKRRYIECDSVIRERQIKKSYKNGRKIQYLKVFQTA